MNLCRFSTRSLYFHSFLFSLLRWSVQCWSPSFRGSASRVRSFVSLAAQATTVSNSASATAVSNSVSAAEDSTQEELFDNFVDFLLSKQADIVQTLEKLESKHGSNAVFTKDTWGMFEKDSEWMDPNRFVLSRENIAVSTKPVGGITRVIQGGSVIEKGACSFTLIGSGILTKERAATIRARQQVNIADDEWTIQEGDEYSAAALTIVFHSRSPHVPTFRSDVRIFLVKPKPRSNDHDATAPLPTIAWFGGGADLTPYFLYEKDITSFHLDYYALCENHWGFDSEYSYRSMKKACDDYFYLPARQEHRGTGGIFFDDMDLTKDSLDFVKGVANAWLPSWIPIVERRQGTPVTEEERHWQLLRRGRYLEFNLLYDRGVKFGLAYANPRVEGVMVSAPPLIAFDYNHPILPGSPQALLIDVLKSPKDWI